LFVCNLAATTRVNKQTYVRFRDGVFGLGHNHISPICTPIQINAAGTLQAPRLGVCSMNFNSPCLRASSALCAYPTGLIYATKRKQTFEAAIKSQDAMFNCRTASVTTEFRRMFPHIRHAICICACLKDGARLPCHISISICHLTHRADACGGG